MKTTTTETAEIDEAPWGAASLHRDGERLASALSRLPKAERKRVRELLKETYVLAEAEGKLDGEACRLSYEASLRLERLWLEVSFIGHAGDNWVEPGRLFLLSEWTKKHDLGILDETLLTRLCDDRRVFALEREAYALWFYNRSMERDGYGRSAPLREYDPTDVPSYEYVWDD